MGTKQNKSSSVFPAELNPVILHVFLLGARGNDYQV